MNQAHKRMQAFYPLIHITNPLPNAICGRDCNTKKNGAGMGTRRVGCSEGFVV